jgi:predicted nuclease with RNAse H fold
VNMVRIAGVDLAAEPAGTALAVLRMTGGDAVGGDAVSLAGDGLAGEGLAADTAASVVLESLQLGVDDAVIVRDTRGVQMMGIDCAFGWPVDFVEFVGRHAAVAGGVATAATAATMSENAASQAPPALRVAATGDLAWRRRLAYRETDRVVAERTGARPLSVATDRLGMTALRCAVLLDRLQAAGRVVDRSGGYGSVVVEVYPAMALRVWGLARPGYKATLDARRALIADLERAAPWLGLGEHRALMVASADALDAVLAALVAVAHVRGASIPPAADQVQRARVEGWMAIPTVGLAELGAVPLTNGIS